MFGDLDEVLDYGIDSGAWSASDNSDKAAKAMVRDAALALVGEARVLDLYAGEGSMYRLAWHRASAYLGIDARPFKEPGRRWIGDNEQLLPRALEEADWNVFDLDSYSNPWGLLARIAELHTGSRLVATLTDGIQHGLRVGKAKPVTQRALGMDGLPMPAGWTSCPPLALRWYPDLVRWLLADCVTAHGWELGTVRTIGSRGSPYTRYWLLDARR